MLDLCPRFITKNLNVTNKRYFTYSLTLICIAVAAYFYLFGGMSNQGLLADVFGWVGRIRTLSHFGYRCPLCGGTRSFIYMFSGNIKASLHHSFFGTFLFLYLYLSLPLRCAITFGHENRAGKLLVRLDSWFENNVIWLIFLGALVQITLDYVGLFHWAA
jgi:hypothetical protein